MPFLVTAHSTTPGQEDFYEEFLKNRKLAFVRALPGVKNYTVFRTEQRADNTMASGNEPMKYNIIAIIEVEDMAAAHDLRSSALYQDFVGEYINLLEDDPTIYTAHEVLQIAEKTKSEFWVSDASK